MVNPIPTANNSPGSGHHLCCVIFTTMVCLRSKDCSFINNKLILIVKLCKLIMIFILNAFHFTTNLITGHHPEFWLRDANKKSFMKLGESVPDPVSQLGDCGIGCVYFGRYWNEYTIYKNII